MFFRRLQIFLLSALLVGGSSLTTRAEKPGAVRESPPDPGHPWSTGLPHKARLDFVWIPAGSFAMGSPAAEPGRHDDEGPQTYVTLNDGYWIATIPTTIGAWKAVMGDSVRDHLAEKMADSTPHDFEGRSETLREYMSWDRSVSLTKYLANEEETLPMYYVSWDDAMAFAAKLTDRERAAGRLPAGYIYTLPTEAQWEYACRAGTATATYLGELNPENVGQIAWYEDNDGAGYHGRGLGTTFSGPRDVAQKAPNSWGLYDMCGNVWEWCRDWYGSYPGGAVTDPAGPKTGSKRVNRGGSFGSGIFSERSAARAANPPAEASAYRGFRLVLTRTP